MGLSSRRRLILLASYRRERKNSSRLSRIAREIEIFSIFAWLFPTLVHIGTRQSAGSRSVEGSRALRGRCRLLSASGGARAKKQKRVPHNSYSITMSWMLAKSSVTKL